MIKKFSIILFIFTFLILPINSLAREDEGSLFMLSDASSENALETSIRNSINESIERIILLAEEDIEEEKKIEKLKNNNETVNNVEELTQLLNYTETISYEELFEIASKMYNMDKVCFNLCLGWFAGDNMEGQDDYWSYLSACCPINHFMNYHHHKQV